VYGFNGKENDNEVKGDGNQQDYGMRIYDPRLGRFLSVDPLMKEYPELTPYQFASNTPIQGIDLDGEEVYHYTLLLQDGKKPVLTYLGVQTREHAAWEVFDNENDFESFNGDKITTKSIQVHAIIREGNGICHAPTVAFSYFKELSDWQAGGFEGSDELKVQAEDTRKYLVAVGAASVARGTLQAGTSTKMPGSITPRASGALKSKTTPQGQTNSQATAATGSSQAAASNTATQTTGKGNYNQVGGHHVHAKAAFKANMNYDAGKGFSISQSYMNQKGWNHQAMTNKQRELFKELSLSGRPNTLTEHSNIAVKSLQAGGATLQEARSLVAESLNNLRKQGVTVPTNIPWYK
jgi:RHS repeat-associated protein